MKKLLIENFFFMQWQKTIEVNSSSIIHCIKIHKNTGFNWPSFSSIGTESMILFLYGKLWVSENPYSRMFYTMWIRFYFQVQNFRVIANKWMSPILNKRFEKFFQTFFWKVYSETFFHSSIFEKQLSLLTIFAKSSILDLRHRVIFVIYWVSFQLTVKTLRKGVEHVPS